LARLQHGRAVFRQGAHWRCRRECTAAAEALLRRRAQYRGGRSLTIIATALIDTGSRMDEVIFEEFKAPATPN